MNKITLIFFVIISPLSFAQQLSDNSTIVSGRYEPGDMTVSAGGVLTFPLHSSDPDGGKFRLGSALKTGGGLSASFDYHILPYLSAGIVSGVHLNKTNIETPEVHTLYMFPVLLRISGVLPLSFSVKNSPVNLDIRPYLGTGAVFSKLTIVSGSTVFFTMQPGIELNYLINGRWAVGLDLSYSWYSEQYSGDSGGPSSSESRNAHFFNTGVLLRYRL